MEEKNTGEKTEEPLEEAPQKKSVFKKVFHILLLIIGVIVLAGVGLYLYFAFVYQQPAVAKTERFAVELDNLRFGVTSDYTAGDPSPLTAFDNHWEIFRNVYSSLVFQDDTGKISPSLATNWYNPDNTTWRFNLREGTEFSNGASFSAEDVKYTWTTLKAITDPDKTQVKDYFSEITSLTVVDKYTIEIKTATPEPYLISKLQSLYIIPNGSVDVTFANTPGTGPFIYNKAETRIGELLVLDRNDKYWGAKPQVKKVSMYTYPEEAEKIQAFKDGKVDIIDTQSTDDVKAASAVAGTTNIKNKDLGVFFLNLNFADDTQGSITGVDGNPIQSQKVRLAMWKALDTNALVQDVMSQIAIPANQMATSAIFGYNPDLKRPAYDLVAARKLMKEAGYENGFTVKIKIVDIRENVGQFIKSAWEKIGIKVELTTFAPEDMGVNMMEMATSGKFATMYLGWTDDAKDIQNTFATLFSSAISETSMNFGFYKNSEVDSKLSKVAQMTNQQERLELLKEIGELLNKDVAAIPLYVKLYNYHAYDNVYWKPWVTTEIYLTEAHGWETRVVEPENTNFWSFLIDLGR